MSETRNIVVLGASYAGLSSAHYIARHVLPKLQASKEAKYALHLVDPSTHFWWNIAAPREIVSVKEMTHEKCFVPIMDGFKQYSSLKDSIIFHHASATGLDTEGRVVSLKTHEGAEETLPYYALVIATGVRCPTPATKLQGHYTISTKALEDLNQKLASAKEIVIGGGGPVGVETAGEVGTRFQGKAKITLVTSGTKLLPVLRQGLSDKVQRQLEKLGVKVVYNSRVTGSTETSDGKTEIKLENGTTMLADVYIPSVGVTPNTEFLPASLKEESNYVKTNKQTLRVDNAGARVYSVGDVSKVDRGGVLNLYEQMPVLGANLSHDLFADAKVGSFAEKKYNWRDSETQLVPVGPKTGVGAFNGWSMPGMAISMIKGKDYMLGQMSDITEGKKMAKA